MKAEIKIPRGWRRLRNGERFSAEDKVFVLSVNKWIDVPYHWDGAKASSDYGCWHIRRIARKKGSK